jgi:hypothetical protein
MKAMGKTRGVAAFIAIDPVRPGPPQLKKHVRSNRIVREPPRQSSNPPRRE